MTTHPDHQPTGDHDPAAEHWWPRLIDHINAWSIQRQPTGPALRKAATIPPIAATIGILTGLAALTAGVAWLAWWLLSTLLDAIGQALTGAANTARVHGAHIGDWPLIRTITDPVRAYLDQHATDLPADVHTLWSTWLVATIGLFILATAGFRGARIGWTLLGAATTAMVYLGTPTNGAPLAAGLTVTAWAVASIAAFNRTTGIPLDLDLPLPPRRGTTDEPADTD